MNDIHINMQCESNRDWTRLDYNSRDPVVNKTSMAVTYPPLGVTVRLIPRFRPELYQRLQ